MAEEKTRPLSRERFKELLKFCGVNLFVIGVVISCRSQAQSDTFFQDAEVHSITLSYSFLDLRSCSMWL